jgi:FkbM family methyltransferase
MTASSIAARTFSAALNALLPAARRDDYDELPIDPTRVEVIGQPSLRIKRWPIALETPPEAWSYAAYFPIPPSIRRAKSALLRVRVRGVRGEPWIGVLTRDEREFIHRTIVADGSDAVEVLVGPLDLAGASRIVLENGASSVSARLTIEAVTMLVPTARPDPVQPPAAPSPDGRPRKTVRLGRHRFLMHGVSNEDPYFQLIGDDFEPEFQSLCQQFVDDDAICVDIGANIGLKTLYLARHVPNGRVIAVEAAPGVAACLRTNLALNAAANVTCVETAIGDRTGSVSFAESSAYGHIASEGIEVPVVTLPELVRRLDLPRLDFVKIDVEGFEYPILTSSLETLDRFRSLVLLEFNGWCQVAFADVDPKEFLTWIFDHFSYIGLLRRSRDGYDLVENVRGWRVVDVLHHVLVNSKCSADLLVTNAPERL